MGWGGDIGLVVRSLEWGIIHFFPGCIHINFIQKETILFVNITRQFLFLFNKNEAKFI